MAQLSEKLVREAIFVISTQKKLFLTVNEVEQALWAWLAWHGYESLPKPTESPSPGRE